MTIPPADSQDVHAVLAWARKAVNARGLDLALLTEPQFDFTESDLLREIAWVILCSGFRERVVRRLFSKISICFLDWSSAAAINCHRGICVATALDVFQSKQKIAAIAESAAIVDEQGFFSNKAEIIQDPINSLQRFPFIGKITVFHLAKNLGFDFPKPDRHLHRLSTKHGYSNVQEFCAAVAYAGGESVRNVDTLLWRISEMGLGEAIRFPSIARGVANTIYRCVE